MVLAALQQHDDDSSNLGAGLNDAKHFMHLFPHVQLNHSQREAKKCGTEIGQVGNDPDTTWFEKPPNVIEDLLLEDGNSV